MSGHRIEITTIDGFAVQIFDAHTDEFLAEANDLDSLDEAIGFVRRFENTHV
jgi:hypothetical protein